MTLTNERGSFSDGSGSNNYQNDMMCEWIIAPPGAKAVELFFPNFLTEQYLDVVTVYGCESVQCPSPVPIAELSGDQSGVSVATRTGVMRIIFSSDFETGYDGFIAHWNSSSNSTANASSSSRRAAEPSRRPYPVSEVTSNLREHSTEVKEGFNVPWAFSLHGRRTAEWQSLALSDMSSKLKEHNSKVERLASLAREKSTTKVLSAHYRQHRDSDAPGLGSLTRRFRVRRRRARRGGGTQKGNPTLEEVCDAWEALADIPPEEAETHADDEMLGKDYGRWGFFLDGANSFISERRGEGIWGNAERVQEENGSESSIWGASPSLRSEMKSAARARTVNLTGSSKEDEDLTLHSFDGVSARRMACLLSRHVRDPETYMRPVVPFMCPALVEDLKSVLPTCVVREQEFIRKLGQSKEKKAMEDLLSISLGNSTLLQTFDLGLCQVEEANKRK